MTAKEYLQQAYKMDKRIRILQGKVDKLHSALEYHSPSLEGSGGGGSADRMPDTISKIMEYEQHVQQLAKIWGKGYVDKVAPLMFDEQGVTGIARYFAQQQTKIVDEYDEPMLVPDLKPKTKRWVSSHNCVKPEPKNYDYKLTKRDVAFYAQNSEDLRIFEKRYPDYFCSQCKPFWNDETGAYYLQVFLYRKDFKPDILLASHW